MWTWSTHIPMCLHIAHVCVAFVFRSSDLIYTYKWSRIQTHFHGLLIEKPMPMHWNRTERINNIYKKKSCGPIVTHILGKSSRSGSVRVVHGGYFKHISCLNIFLLQANDHSVVDLTKRKWLLTKISILCQNIIWEYCLLVERLYLSRMRWYDCIGDLEGWLSLYEVTLNVSFATMNQSRLRRSICLMKEWILLNFMVQQTRSIWVIDWF